MQIYSTIYLERVSFTVCKLYLSKQQSKTYTHTLKKRWAIKSPSWKGVVCLYSSKTLKCIWKKSIKAVACLWEDRQITGRDHMSTKSVPLYVIIQDWVKRGPSKIMGGEEKDSSMNCCKILTGEHFLSLDLYFTYHKISFITKSASNL